MKEGIHPKAAKVTAACSCGATYELISTRKNIRVEVCSNCHPFYTGSQRQVTVGGRIERFNKRHNR